MKEIISKLKITGRTYFEDDTLWLCYSGSSVSFKMQGSYAGITVKPDRYYKSYDKTMHARIAVYLNGTRVRDELIDNQTKTIVIETSAGHESEIEVIKLSECVMSLAGIAGIETDSDYIAPVPARKHRIEFIGDSITCGYGIDDECKDNTFSTSTEDFTRAYAYKTAKLLDADYSAVSISGCGIISGYTSDGKINTDQLLMPQYDFCGFSKPKDENDIMSTFIRPQWDFSSFIPDAVVLFLGTNDYSYCKCDQKKCEDFEDQYIKELIKIRKRNPSAVIFACIGIMDSNLFGTILKAVNRFKSYTGDTSIYALELPYHKNEDGYAADWHPTEKSNTRAAGVLSEYIRKIMKW
ncbi:MAG: GDSL-type esterase/lipase family protein [Oscillospiraceae bacterium]|nr:GDSL-type esterase/lipase family protein [Oscillospiraceae bacterium]